MKLSCLTQGVIHPSLIAQKALKNWLNSQRNINVQYLSSFDDFKNLTQSKSKVLLLYFHRQNIHESALKALEDYVFQGGGLVALHSVSASFKQTKNFAPFLGGKFKSHYPVQKFVVHSSLLEPQLFSAQQSFELKDEIYTHDFYGEVSVHFYTEFENKNIPLVWSKKWGKGNIVYLSPGHKASSLENPAFQKILLQSMQIASVDSALNP